MLIVCKNFMYRMFRNLINKLRGVIKNMEENEKNTTKNEVSNCALFKNIGCYAFI